MQMKEQLTAYVDLLFAGAADADDIKQEILQNTLDRYDDLLEQGKSPQAAYSLAIAGIGDISELLSHNTPAESAATYHGTPVKTAASRKPTWKIILQAIGICLYILCPIPLFALPNTLGLCGLLSIVAIATALMIISGDNQKKSETKEDDQPLTPQQKQRKAVKSIISTVGLCCYLGISFLSGAWHITWLIFPIVAAIQGLINACLDLKEANHYET